MASAGRRRRGGRRVTRLRGRRGEEREEWSKEARRARLRPIGTGS
jgi:hypothetical protein